MNGDDMAVRKERTAWRDRALSERHREWGYNAPFADIDAVWIEYDMGKVMGLFEYKRETAPWPPDRADKTLSAIADMADRGRVPFFVVRYATALSWFEPRCWSNVAHMGWAAFNARRLTEVEYVTFLYKLRTREVPAALLDALRRRAA